MTNETTKIPRREFGHIYQRGVLYWVRYRVDGTTYRESTGSTDRRKAEKVLARKEAELSIGAFVTPDVKRTRFEDLAQMIRDDYRVRELRSGGLLENSLRHLAEHFTGARASAITPARLTAYVRARLDELKKGKPPALRTIENELNALKHAMRLAKKDGKLAGVPEFPTLAKPNPRAGFFEPEEFAALLAELAAPLQGPTEFAYITGWRKQEVLDLTWDRVDWAAGVVKLEGSGTKNKEGRTFPFAVMPRLKSLLEERRDQKLVHEITTSSIIQHVFHRNGQPIKDFYAAWEHACGRAARDQKGAIVRPQLIGRLFHDLRRTAVRNLVRAGVPEQTAMKLTGHKTRAVFDRYDIVNEKDLAEAVAKLAVYHEVLGKAVAR
jgi:integrase